MWYSKEILESLCGAAVSWLYKTTFWEESNSNLTIKSFLGPSGYIGWLKKWTFYLPKVFLILFPWVATVIAASSVFAYLPGLSNHSQIVYLKSFFTSWSSVFFFTHVRIVISVIDIWVVYRLNFLSTKHWCSIYVTNNTTCFVCWLSVKIKRNFYVFWHNDTISWATSYFNQYVGSYRKDLVCLPWIYVIPCL